MICAISNWGEMVFAVIEGSFNGELFIRFLQKLLKSVKQKVFLIADSYPVHVQKRVTGWLQDHKQAIEMIRLPTYSPELNADEYFNQDLKTNGVGKPRPENKAELIVLAERFASRKKRNPEQVKRDFHPSPVAYAR